MYLFEGKGKDTHLQYDNGTFKVEWNPKFIPHILQLKEKYIVTDLTITSNFRSGFSWTLYEFIKAHYGYWRKSVSKEALMRLFGVEDRKSYIKSTAQFKRGVLDIAISEINEFTELEVFYTEEKKGRAIVGFNLIWSTGVMQNSASKKQIKELKKIIDIVLVDSFKFIDLDNGDNRRRAMKIIEEMKEMSGYTTEPIQITGKKADSYD